VAIKVLFADDKSSPNDVASKIQELVDRDRVVALIGEIASSRSLVGAMIATKKGVPMISPASTNAQVTRNNGFAFRVCFVDEVQGRMGADFAVNVLKKKKIALAFAEDDLYSQGLASEFEKAAKALGATIVAEQKFSQRETSFARYVKDLKLARPELVYAPLYYQQMLQLGRQAKAEGMGGGMFLGGDGWSGEQALYDELEGAHYTDHWALDLPWPVSRKFVAAYASKFGKPPSSVAATSYDALWCSPTR
jgi:branched-chain amino acid transport system substrate-binding protein